MATSVDHSVKTSISDDFLTCHICYEIFTDPRILPCLHTYCFQCICSHVDSAQENRRPIICPECREPFTDVVSSLKINFFVNGLTEVIREKTAETLPCSSCLLRGTESIAKVKCLDCGDSLCSACADGHNASSVTWKHEKIPLDEIRQGTYDPKLRVLQRIKCSKHEDKDVEFYCESCSKSICLTCVLLDHRDHKCKTISEAACDMKPNIIRLTQKLKESLAVFVSEESQVISKLTALKVSEESEISEIENKARQEIAKIQAAKITEMEKTERKSKVAQKECEAELESLRLQKSLVSSCVNFSDNILKRGKDEEVLMLEAMITERLQYLHKSVTPEDIVQSSHQPSDTDSTTRKDKVRNRELVLDNIIRDTDSPTKSDSTLVASEDEPSTTATSNESTYSNTEKEITVKFKKQRVLSAKWAKDLVEPDIKGMVYSFSVGLVIADKHNGMIKVLNKSGSLKREITTDGFRPFAVAVVGNIIGAVSENCLYLFTSTGSLKTKVKVTEVKPYQSLHFTYCLTVSETLGFVLGNIYGDNRLRFYNKDGILTKTLRCSLALPVASVSLTPSGDIVLSEWGSGSLRVISPDGKLIFRVTEPGWKPNGTCVAQDGTIYVADYHWQCVGVYSRNGDHLVDFKTSSDGVKNPVSVAVDEDGTLYVTGNAGKICVYKVHKTEK